MARCIWLIGGTSESAKIGKMLAAEGLPCTVTVTTELARSLYPDSPHLKIAVGQLDRSQSENFCYRESIAAIVDASHPHAANISQTAIAVANCCCLPYLRYERPPLEDVSAGTAGDLVRELDSFEVLLSGNYLAGERVMLAIGYKMLPSFRPWQEKATLFARILPGVNSLKVAMKAGFTSERLIAIRPPLSAAFERALWQQWQISLVVTKASGEAGGEKIKRATARELDIPLLVIGRPKLTYPQQTSDLATVLTFCRQHISTV